MSTRRGIASSTYAEGTWFAVPLPQTSRFAVGIAARLNGKGKVVGYFFGPDREQVPSLAEVCELKAQQAILVMQFGDLGLIEGTWPILGTCGDWKREEWPLPVFSRIDKIENVAWTVTYSDDTLALVREDRVDPARAAHHPDDGLAGADAVGLQLARILRRSGTS